MVDVHLVNVFGDDDLGRRVEVGTVGAERSVLSDRVNRFCQNTTGITTNLVRQPPEVNTFCQNSTRPITNLVTLLLPVGDRSRAVARYQHSGGGNLR